MTQQGKPPEIPASEIQILPVLEEVARISRRRRETGRVRVSVGSETEERLLRETLRGRRAEVERVPIDREVAATPPMRQEGDTIVIPVMEERLVVERRLVLREELHLRLIPTEEQVELSLPIRRQSATIERLPPEGAAGQIYHDDSAEDFSMTSRTVTAMFDNRAEAERAAQTLASMGIDRDRVQVHAAETGSSAAEASANEGGFLASLANLFVPDDDRATYHEGIRRGGVLLSAEVPEERCEAAMDALEAAGAVDLDTREAEWRQGGWSQGSWTGGNAAGLAAGTGVVGASSDGDRTGVSAMPGGSGADLSANRTDARLAGTSAVGGDLGTGGGVTGVGATGASFGARAGATGDIADTDAATSPALATTGTTTGTGRTESIPLAEERLRVGKREAAGGRVRVRSYVVETPVQEQVTLREEHVSVERHPVDRPASEAEAALFQDRTIEATETSEEAVIAKDVRVREEVVVRKDATERTETVRDSVRRTEVEVDDDRKATGTTTGTGTSTERKLDR